jgi:carbon storage regulator
MLVLTRKSEEKVTIGKDKKVVITILKIQGDKVSLGIEADKETPIFRNELISDNPQEMTQVELEAS